MSRWLLATITFILLLLATAIFCGCIGSPTTPASGEIKKFNSTDEIRQYIQTNTKLAAEAEGDSGGAEVLVRNMDAAPIPPAAVAGESAAKSVTGTVPSAGTGAAGYSQTNVQVAGVDEPDFVKNDGKYIYVISGETLTIVDAYPPSAASIVSKTTLDAMPQEIFVSGDRLVLFLTDAASSDNTDGPVYATQIRSMPSYLSDRKITRLIFYDISDRKSPRILKEYTIDGDYMNARLIGNTVYLVTRENVYVSADEKITVPCVREKTSCVVTPDVYYFDNPERTYAFTTISSYRLKSGTGEDAKTYLVGSGNILYVSPDAMYISYQKNHNAYRRGWTGPVRIDDGSTSGSSVPAPGRTAPILWEDFNRMSEAEKERLLAEMKGQEEEKILRQEIDQSTTVIHKIAIDNGAITYIARGEVPGYLDSQFGMDEHNSNLRVATTSDVYTGRGSYEYNNVFIFDPAMKILGSLTHIAEQEKIYSTRFMGDRLYMVTYKRVDPFFVIDLSDPKKPAILGKLKIPGYSDYLHPYDSTHIIGLGKETAANDWGGISTQGIKLALFDVSDVANPRQVGKVEIGDSGSDSAALADHRAFLFDRTKNLLVIPARVVRQDADPSQKLSGDQPRIWYGAYVFGVDPQSGFILRGTVEHGTQGERYYWYGSSRNEVRRSLYIGEILYTLSKAKILANPLDQINTTVATIPLDSREDVLYPPVLIE